MYNISKNSKINEDEELNAIIELVENRWGNIDKDQLEQIIRLTWDASLEVTKYRYDGLCMNEIINTWLSDRSNKGKWLRNNISEKEIDLIPLYDSIMTQVINLSLGNFTLQQYLNKDWQFEKSLNKIINDVSSIYPQCKSLLPLDWDKLKKFKTSSEKKEYSIEQDEANMILFKGCNSENYSSLGFDKRISLTHVGYQHEEQGKTPYYTLLGAVLGHAMFVREHNNGLDIKNELQIIKENFNTNEYYNKLQYNIDFSSLINNKILKVLFSLGQIEKPIYNSEEEFREIIKNTIINMENSHGVNNNFEQESKEMKKRLSQENYNQEIVFKEKMKYNLIESILNDHIVLKNKIIF